MTVEQRDSWVRWIWLAGLAGVLGIYVAGMPASREIAAAFSPATQAQLERLGVPVGLPSVYLLLIDTLELLFFAGVATVLIWQRPGERMARLAAILLLSAALLYTAPAYEAPIPIWLMAMLSAGAEVAQFAFVFAFPNGRFVPRWMGWALIPLAVWRFVVWNGAYLPNLYAITRTGEEYPYLPQDPIDLLLVLGVILAGVGVQVYRYRRLDTPTERQQVKWLLWGMVGAVALVGGYVLLINLFGSRIPAQHELLVRLVARTLRHTALALVPISLLYSILHHRLWEIDTLLNRTLAWGTLTVLFALVFGGAIVLLQLLMAPRAAVGSAAYTVVIAVSTLVTVALARPLHRRVQSTLDRRFNRRTWEARRVIAEVRSRLREQVATEQLASHVLAVVQETWQPESAVLWIPESQGAHRRPSVRFAVQE